MDLKCLPDNLFSSNLLFYSQGSGFLLVTWTVLLLGGVTLSLGWIALLWASSSRWTAGLSATPTCVCHPGRVYSLEHHFCGADSYIGRLTSSSPTSWQLSRAHLFCSFIKELRTPPAYSCGEGRGNETSGSFSAMPWLPFWIFSVVLTEMRGKHCGWKHLRSFFYPPKACLVVMW